MKPGFRKDVSFRALDIQQQPSDGPFDLILCRNLVFTYFVAPAQSGVLRAIEARLAPGGYLVIGAHERLLEEGSGLVPVAPGLPVYCKAGPAARGGGPERS